jgi:hypothetical protein
MNCPADGGSYISDDRKMADPGNICAVVALGDKISYSSAVMLPFGIFTTSA